MLPSKSSIKHYAFLCFFGSVLFLSGCTKTATGTQTVKNTNFPSTPTLQQAQASPSPLPSATATAEPAAATVNGEIIPVREFNAELKRYQTAQPSPAAVGTPSAPDSDKKIVIDDLVDQVLLAQAAVKDGYPNKDSDLKARLDQLSTELGSPQALADWQSAHGYTDEEFREALKQQAAAAWERDQILKQVPTVAEQVHARQILVSDEDSAKKALSRLIPGLDFATLAYKYDPISGGDLGWFPKGYLNVPEVEDAAFSLQPGAISSVIHSKLGYHILQVIEKDLQHPLSPDARLVLQQKQLKKWMEDRRAASQISLTLP